MTKLIDYYFTPVSPFMYLGHDRFVAALNEDQILPEEALTAGRSAIDTQRKVCLLAPTAANTLELGNRYLQLGRKLCELGRIRMVASSMKDIHENSRKHLCWTGSRCNPKPSSFARGNTDSTVAKLHSSRFNGLRIHKP